MFVLGIQGSPQKNGNTSILLSHFLDEAERLGSRTYHLYVTAKNIHPCVGCGVCEKEGFCTISDDMSEVYSLLRQADIIVIATPVFFYSVPAQLKALIDRSQTLWARKYIHKLKDPGEKWKGGFLLALGATKGKNLFEGLSLTTKYFFDAVGARFNGRLTFRQIEKIGDIEKHLTALRKAKEKASLLISPFLNRKKVLFICKENRCRSQMASAFTKYYGGERIDAESAGSNPGQKVNDLMVEVMKEKGFDMAFQRPKSINEVLSHTRPDLIVSMGCEEGCLFFPDTPVQDWNLPDPADKLINFMRKVRDEIEERVKNMIETI